MDLKLEVVVVPVSDVDRAKVFHDETGIFHHAGTLGRVNGPAENRGSYGCPSRRW